MKKLLLLALAILGFFVVSLCACSRQEKVQLNRQNVVNAEFRGRFLYVDVLDDNDLVRHFELNLRLHDVNVVADQGLDGTRCDASIVYNSDLNLFLGEAVGNLTIYVRTMEQKEEWYKTLSAVRKREFGPRDVLPTIKEN